MEAAREVVQRAEVQEGNVPGAVESLRLVEARHGSLVQRGSPSWNRGEAERRGRVEDGGKRGRRSVIDHGTQTDVRSTGFKRKKCRKHQVHDDNHLWMAGPH